MTELPPRIVLYDGECGLCHRAVQWLMRHERPGAFHFAALQGETAATLRARHREIPTDLDSVVYVEEGAVHLRTMAFLHAARHLTGPWRWLHALRHLPAWLVDPAYRVVARLRYRLFGRHDSCIVPRTDRPRQLLP